MATVLLIVSVVLFALASFGKDVLFGELYVVPLGLAFFAASFLVEPVTTYVQRRNP